MFNDKLDFLLTVSCISICCTALSYFGSLHLWPQIDNIPLLLRWLDPNFLKHDSFINIAAEHNPRHIVTYLLLSAVRLFEISWERLFSISHSVVSAFQAGLVVIGLGLAAHQSLLKTPNSSRCRQVTFIILLGLAAVVGTTVLANALHVGFSPRIGITGLIPSNVAIFLAAGAMILHHQRNIFSVILAVIIAFGAAVIHPVSASSFLIGYLLLAFMFGAQSLKKNFALLIGGMILPMIFILVLFTDANNTITGQIYSDIYAHLRHPHHYIPSEYTGYYIIPWPVSFGAVLFVFLINALIAKKRSDKKHVIVSVLGMLYYGSTLPAQYLTVEVFSIDAFVSLAPIRYAIVGYWLAAILSVRSICYHTPVPLYLSKRFFEIPFRTKKTLAAVLISLSLFMIILNENKSLQKIYLEKDQVVEQWSWLSQTNGQITILPPGISTVGFREFLGISPFVDDYFPFVQSRLDIYADRWRSIYGNHSRMHKEKKAEFYNQLTVTDFKRIRDNWGARYVVINKQQAKNMLPLQPVGQHGDFRIYHLD